MKLKKYSKRFIKISQLLFTSDISDNEISIAKQVINTFEKAENDLHSWLESIENNLNVFKEYDKNNQGNESKLVGISEVFQSTIEKQKQKYEKVINSIRQAIESVGSIQDIEMKDMITNLTKASEDFTELYNELIDLPIKIGENGFLEQFINISQDLKNNNESFFDVIQHIKEYMLTNIVGEQKLT